MADEQPKPTKTTETAPPPAAPTKPVDTSIEVRAIRRGHYADRMREEGEVFRIAGPAQHGSWMYPLEAKDRERIAAYVAELLKAAREKARETGDQRDKNIAAGLADRLEQIKDLRPAAPVQSVKPTPAMRLK